MGVYPEFSIRNIGEEIRRKEKQLISTFEIFNNFGQAIITFALYGGKKVARISQSGCK